MRGCLQEGLLQSYLDDAVSAEERRAVESHLSACRACADTIATLNREMNAVSDAFAALLSAPVPAERLRERLKVAIDREALTTRLSGASLRPGAHALLSSLVSSVLSSRRYAFSAVSAALAVSVLVALLILRAGHSTEEMAGDGRTSPEGQQAQVGVGTPLARAVVTPPSSNDAREDLEGRVGEGGRVAPAARPLRSRAAAPRSLRGQTPAYSDATPTESAAADGLRSQEQAYVRSISLITESLQAGGAGTLKPSLRVEYERNLAVFDVAIAATKHAALRNPRDANARQFLWSAYRDKLEFLNRITARKGQDPLAEE